VDVFEIGVPSPRPKLDGATVRDSMSRALAAGTDTVAAARSIASLRGSFPDQAMLWMTYPDVVGEGWTEAVAWSGVDGVLIPERAAAHRSLAAGLEREGVAFAHFVGSPARPEDLAAARTARGYVMVQARPGVTGEGEADEEMPSTLRALRELGLEAPIAVGFGVRDPAAAKRVAAAGADAVVVGSAMVEAALAGPDRLRSLVRSLREALDE
jgi:tryptophan synthase alpha chain